MRSRNSLGTHAGRNGNRRDSDSKSKTALTPRMDEPQRRVATFEAHRCFGVRSAIGGEMFERPAIDDERLFDRGLVKRRVHRFTKSRVAETAARSIHANRRPVDHDADGLGAADEQPGFGGT